MDLCHRGKRLEKTTELARKKYDCTKIMETKRINQKGQDLQGKSTTDSKHSNSNETFLNVVKKL